MAFFEVRPLIELDSDEAVQPRALFDIGTEGITIGAESDTLIWTSIAVPADARPGTYRGTLEFRSDDEQFANLPLTLQVHKPIMPDPQHGTLGAQVWQTWALLGSYQGLAAFSESWWHLADDYVGLLAALGVNGAHPGRAFCDWRRVAAGQWQFDFSRFDRFRDLGRRHWPSNEISYLGMFSTVGPTQIYYIGADGEAHAVDTAPGEELYDEAWSAFAEALARHCRNAGCFADLYVWPADRPSTARQVADFIHCVGLLRAADPEYRIAVTVENAQLARQLADHVDRVVLPLLGPDSPDPALVAELKAMGRQVWGYLEERPGCPGLSAGLPAVYAYAVGPLAKHLQLDGILISSHLGLPATDGTQDGAEATIGSATLLYVTDGVCRSLEAERLLMGLQDAELMHMAGREAIQPWLTDTGLSDDWMLFARHADQLRLRALTLAASSSGDF